MNRLQKLSSQLAQIDRCAPVRRQRRAVKRPPHGSWRRLIEKLARHPGRYLP